MPRHDGRVIWLTYKPEGNVKKTVYLVSQLGLKILGRCKLFFLYVISVRLARESPTTLVALTSRPEVSWQVCYQRNKVGDAEIRIFSKHTSVNTIQTS